MSTNIRKFFNYALFFTFFFSLDVIAGSPLLFIENKFIQKVSAGWNSFEICEYRSPNEDRVAFFAKALDFEPARGVKTVRAKEFILRENSGDRGFNLGIIELEFPTPQFALRVHTPAPNNTQRFFSGRKILTRYVSLQKGRRVIVVYSETYRNTKVESFLDQVNKLGDQAWASSASEE